MILTLSLSAPKALRRFFLGDKLITVSAHGEEMPRALCILFQLLPQKSNVHVDGARQHSTFIAPNVSQQLIARKRSAALFDEVAQQLKLSRRELNRPARTKHFGAAKVHHHGAEAKGFGQFG